MPDIEYQKIVLHSTHDLVKDHEIIEHERIVAQKLMEDNRIQFAIEIKQVEEKIPTGRLTTITYFLNLIVRKEDVERVVGLLDKEGDFGYYVDLDYTFNSNEESENVEENQEAYIDLPEELKEEVVEEDISDDPIKMYGEEEIENEEDLDNYKIKFKPKLDYKSFPRFVMKFFLSVAFMIILIPEIVGIVYGIKELEYEIATTMFVFIVIETPIFIWFYNILNKKKK